MGFPGALCFFDQVVLRADLSEISSLLFLGLTLIFIGIDLIYEWMLISFDILPQTDANKWIRQYLCTYKLERLRVRYDLYVTSTKIMVKIVMNQSLFFRVRLVLAKILCGHTLPWSQINLVMHTSYHIYTSIDFFGFLEFKVEYMVFVLCSFVKNTNHRHKQFSHNVLLFKEDVSRSPSHNSYRCGSLSR